MFFLTHKGVFRSPNYYFCSYCGKLLHRKNVQVDHLISVHSVSRPGMGRVIMKLARIHDINESSNLIPSCQYCNKQKGAKGGMWLVRGFLGRKSFYWFFRKSIYLATYIILIHINLPSIINLFHKIF